MQILSVDEMGAERIMGAINAGRCPQCFRRVRASLHPAGVLVGVCSRAKGHGTHIFDGERWTYVTLSIRQINQRAGKPAPATKPTVASL